ncbi:hypothetical protein [Rossellomorea sp. SC111]|uniref:hypothetical protein n=1 Tax=Rossellomorea sp. SC111 TaxID=2968985 RepID=UPI00215B2776|nr:hypothetical protein [Rossellomorea sp. SC111]
MGCSKSIVEHNERIEEAIYSIVNDQNNKNIELNSIAEFNWGKAYLFPPYTSQGSIEKQLGIEYDDPSQISIRDDIYLLVFLYEGEVVQYAEINRQKADFTTGDKEYLTPSEDVLKVERH